MNHALMSSVLIEAHELPLFYIHVTLHSFRGGGGADNTNRCDTFRGGGVFGGCHGCDRRYRETLPYETTVARSPSLQKTLASVDSGYAVEWILDKFSREFISLVRIRQQSTLDVIRVIALYMYHK